MKKIKPPQFYVVARQLEDGTTVYILVSRRTQEEVGFFMTREEANAFIFSR